MMRSEKLNYGLITSHTDADHSICNKIPLEEQNINGMENWGASDWYEESHFDVSQLMWIVFFSCVYKTNCLKRIVSIFCKLIFL